MVVVSEEVVVVVESKIRERKELELIKKRLQIIILEQVIVEAVEVDEFHLINKRKEIL